MGSDSHRLDELIVKDRISLMRVSAIHCPSSGFLSAQRCGVSSVLARGKIGWIWLSQSSVASANSKMSSITPGRLAGQRAFAVKPVRTTLGA